MAQVDSENSTAMPVVSTRRRFLSNAAGIAAGGTLLALAIPPVPAAAAAFDPVFDLIAAHRAFDATVHAIEAETRRQSDLGIYVETDENDIAPSSGAEMRLFLELLEVVPTTLAGVVALVAYLDEINKQDPWKFQDNYATPLIGNLAVAFSRIGAAS
jgi:hypothetical protein